MNESLSCWFFVSYAWGDNPDADPDGSNVSEFYKVIADTIAPKIHEDLKAVGFLDRKVIDNGDVWKASLSSALRGCRTFIPLLTQRYFTREACGREWAAFASRARHHGQLPGLILPVLWDKPKRVENAIPFPELQSMFTEERFGRDVEHLLEYKRLGMSALMKRYRNDSKAANTIQVIVDALTDQIVERWEQCRLPSAPQGVVVDWDGIVPEFGTTVTLQAAPASSRRAAVHFAVAAGTVDEIASERRGADFFYPGEDRDWIPFANVVGTSATQLALEASRGLGLQCKWLDAKDQLVKAIRALEGAGNEPVVLLVDPWSLSVRAIEQSLADFDQYRFRNAMVVVACNPYENVDRTFVAADERWTRVEGKIRTIFSRTFPSLGDNSAFVANVRDIDSLRSALERTIAAMRGITATERPVQRAVESSDVIPVNQN